MIGLKPLKEMEAFPLMDQTGFVRELEKAYQAMRM